jgi:rod shape-determining protein MreD
MKPPGIGASASASSAASPASAASERLRAGAQPRRERVRPADAEVWVRPQPLVLVAVTVGAVILQTTLLRGVRLHGAGLSLVTIVVVWIGLRCGVTTGGLCGLLAGLVEDGLGGAGANVLGTTLAGFGAGLLSARFFPDSVPVFTGAVAAATAVRAIVTYLVVEFGIGERGLFHRLSHEVIWQMLFNSAAAAIGLVAWRAWRR